MSWSCPALSNSTDSRLRTVFTKSDGSSYYIKFLGGAYIIVGITKIILSAFLEELKLQSCNEFMQCFDFCSHDFEKTIFYTHMHS